MIVGAAVIELHIHGSQSRKARRGVVRSIQQRVRNRFDVSVAEVGGQETWQFCVLGLTAGGGDAATVRRVLERACEYIETLHLAEVRSMDIEIMDLPHAEAPWEGDDEGLDDLPDGDDRDGD